VTVKDEQGLNGRQVFRSPAAVAVWWLWVLFALGNLIDLAVQGRDHTALVAALALLLVTGVVYVTALRPRLVADDAGLTVANPVRQHLIGWAAFDRADQADLLRIRCEWPAGGQQRTRAVTAWGVHSPRRRQLTAQLRQRRRAARSDRGAGGFGNFGWTGSTGRPPSRDRDPLTLDAGFIIAILSARAEQAKKAAPGTVATAPVSTWYWPGIAAVALPALALLVSVLA
jgi:Bacterial PH domain